MSSTNIDFDPKREALWQNWQCLEAQIDEILLQGVSHYYTNLRQAVCNMLILDALSLARLGQKDEGVFDHLVYLMETYREVISLFNDPIKDESPKLVAGLCDILCSRLKQFEDENIGLCNSDWSPAKRAARPCNPDWSPTKWAARPCNPVAMEKYAILDEGVLRAMQKIQELEELHTHELESLTILVQNPDSVWPTLEKSIAEKTLPELYNHYTKNLRNCLIGIDDLHTRKTACYYTDLLEREWEVLGLIVQVQVQALEAAYRDNEKAHAILSKLREAYQQTGPVVSGLRKLMQTASPPPQVADFEIFVAAACLASPVDMQVDFQAFLAALMPEADAIFEELRNSNMEQAHGLNNLIAADIELAKKVVAVFKDAKSSLEWMINEQTVVSLDANTSDPCDDEDVSSQDSIIQPCSDESIHCHEDIPQPTQYGNGVYNQDCPHLPSLAVVCDQNKQILHGIIETLDIKSDSLHESLGLFIEDSERLISTFAKDIPKLSEENLTNAASQLLTAWFECPPTLEGLTNFFEACVSLEAFVAYSEKFAKHVTNISTKVEKASFRFKKETLLYEISTYEEILYHSVSRLRQSPAATDFVRILDEIFYELEAMITDYGITIIRPTPHDPFNGREHEVLMAEVQEGFAKGEIIKVMTSGYKQNDQVIIRANVIAAR